MHRVDELNSPDDFDSVAAAWSRLLGETPRATFFQSREWLQVYWRHFGEAQKLRFLIVSDKERPIGILPLVVRLEKTRVGRLRFLTYPLDSWGSFYGPIGSDPAVILEAGLQHIRRTPRDWDALELRWIAPTGDLLNVTSRMLHNNGLRATTTCHARTALIRLEDTHWDAYLAERSSKWRNNLRRWERRAGEAGQLQFVRYRPPADSSAPGERWDLYDDCLQIAHSSWQGESTTGTTLTHTSVREFLRDVHAAAVAAGAVDINLLYLGNRPVAFAYNYNYRGYVYGLRVGFDRQMSKLGVGNLLYVKTIEDSFRRGDRVYDLGPGSLDCKRHLMTDVLPIYRCSHFPRFPLRAQLLRIRRRWEAPTIEDIRLTSA